MGEQDVGACQKRCEYIWQPVSVENAADDDNGIYLAAAVVVVVAEAAGEVSSVVSN